MELKKHLSNNGIHEEERRIIMENIKALGGMDKNGRKGNAAKEKWENQTMTYRSFGESIWEIL